MKHIKALGSAIFAHAVDEEILKTHGLKSKFHKDAIDPEATKHCTLEKTEDTFPTHDLFAANEKPGGYTSGRRSAGIKS